MELDSCGVDLRRQGASASSLHLNEIMQGLGNSALGIAAMGIVQSTALGIVSIGIARGIIALGISQGTMTLGIVSMGLRRGLWRWGMRLGILLR